MVGQCAGRLSNRGLAEPFDRYYSIIQRESDVKSVSCCSGGMQMRLEYPKPGSEAHMVQESGFSGRNRSFYFSKKTR